jgi:fructose-1,6-bisphosphatase
MAYIVEQAGGTALTCKLERIMDIKVDKLHQTSSIALGSHDMMADMQEFVNRYGPVN